MRDLPEIKAGEVPDKWGNNKIKVLGYQHPQQDCGLMVHIRCGEPESSLSFSHYMTTEQARALAEMLTLAADYMEREQVPYPETEGA